MKSILIILISLGFALVCLTSCQRIGGCPYPPHFYDTSESFVLGFYPQVDSVDYSVSDYKVTDISLDYHNPEPIFREQYSDWSKLRSSSDSVAIVVSFISKRPFSIRDRKDLQQIYRPKLEQYGDVNFNRVVSGHTTLYKEERSGRVVLDETVTGIKVVANQDFGSLKSGDDISHAFLLAYTNPLKVGQSHTSFSEAEAGDDYKFVKFSGFHCDIGGANPRFDNVQNMYKVDLPAPFQWYDGEYFPCVIYQKLTEVPFAEIKHLSAIAALVPTVYPSEPCEVSFTIEVNFSNGKTLSSTTPMLKFSGL